MQVHHRIIALTQTCTQNLMGLTFQCTPPKVCGSDFVMLVCSMLTFNLILCTGCVSITTVAKQSNGYDCGIFVILCVYGILSLELEFSEDNFGSVGEPFSSILDGTFMTSMPNTGNIRKGCVKLMKSLVDVNTRVKLNSR